MSKLSIVFVRLLESVAAGRLKLTTQLMNQYFFYTLCGMERHRTFIRIVAMLTMQHFLCVAAIKRV